MKLEVGKKYRTKQGDVVTVEDKSGSPSMPYYATGHRHKHSSVSYGQWHYEDGSTSWAGHTITEEIKESEVSNKVDRLNKLVDEMPVCNDGKAKIRALVEEITGEKLVKPTLKVGQILRNAEGTIVQVVQHNWNCRYTLLCLTGTAAGQLFGLFKDSLDGVASEWSHFNEPVADSLQQYVANGGTL